MLRRTREFLARALYVAPQFRVSSADRSCHSWSLAFLPTALHHRLYRRWLGARASLPDVEKVTVKVRALRGGGLLGVLSSMSSISSMWFVELSCADLASEVCRSPNGCPSGQAA